MPYELKPLSCDPAKLTGLSEKLIVSHWENNYGGAVKPLNAIEQKLAQLNWAAAPVFEINGLKREEMILPPRGRLGLGASTSAEGVTILAFSRET